MLKKRTFFVLTLTCMLAIRKILGFKCHEIFKQYIALSVGILT